MAEIRSTVTVPVTANFAGIGAYTPCSPLCYVESTGDLYVLITPDIVVKIGTAISSLDNFLASQVYARHVVPAPDDVSNANEQIANRAFAIRTFPNPTVANTNNDLETQVFARHIQPEPEDVGNANRQIAGRAISQHPQSTPADQGDANEQLANQVLAKHVPFPYSDVGDANAHISNRALDKQSFPLPPVNNTIPELGPNIFGVHLFSVPEDVGDANRNLAIRALDRNINAVVLGDANDIIRGLSFAQHPTFAPLNFSTSTIIENRVFRTAQLPAMWT